MFSKWMSSKTFIVASAAGGIMGGIVILKDFMGGSNYKGNESLKGKTVIITGANTGIGMEAAAEFARREARVIMACRNLKKCKQAQRDIILDSRNKNVLCRECDLASQVSIRKFAEKIHKTEKRVDILVNNAGVMRCKKSHTKEGIELQLGTNHMGHFLLTNLLLDMIKESSPSRIITVSSVAHSRAKLNFSDLNSDKEYDEATAYNQSKLANILFSNHLANLLQGTRVTSNSVHPGLVNTEITRHMSVSQSVFAYILVKPLLWLFLRTPRQGAQTTIYVALNKDLENTSGKYFSNKAEAVASEAAHNIVDAKRLWAISLKWTGLM